LIPIENLSWLTIIKNEPLFNGISDEPEFQKIVRDEGARYLEEHESVRKWLVEQGRMKSL